MRSTGPGLLLFLLLALAIAGCENASETVTPTWHALDYSWVRTTPWAELPGHYDRANLFMAKNYYDRQAAYASGEIPPPRLLKDSYSSHPLAYYAIAGNSAVHENERLATELSGASPASRSEPARAAAETETSAAADPAARHFSRGLTYYDLGDFESAIKEFTRALQFDARHARAYAFRALAYGYTGSSAKAQADLQSAIRLNADPKLIEEVRRALQQDS